MISFKEFRSQCKKILAKKIVTADDYLDVLGGYIEMFIQYEEQSYLSRRYYLLVESKHLRTCFAALPNSQPQKRLCAFRSHARYERNSSPNADTNHHRQGRRMITVTGQLIRRYLTGLVRDMFKTVPPEGLGFVRAKPESQGGCQAKRGQYVPNRLQTR